MGWPDLHLSHNSKNNMVWQQKYYQYTWTESEVYQFDYKYDGDGYPKELIQQLRNPVTKAHLSTIKTVFSY